MTRSPAVTVRLCEAPAHVAVEQMASFVLAVENAGQPATFEARAEGVPHHWIALSPARLVLPPGASGTLAAIVTAPRLRDSVAGRYPLALSVCSPEHPGWQSRHEAPFALLPFDALDAPANPAGAPSRTTLPLARLLVLGALLLALVLGAGWWMRRPAAPASPVAQAAGAGQPPASFQGLPVAIGAQWSAPLPTPTPAPTGTPVPPPPPLVVKVVAAHVAPPPLPPPSAPEAPVAAPVPDPTSYEALFREVGAQYGLDWRLLASIAYQESRLNPAAVGQDGDMGLMQILPSTWEELVPLGGATDPFDPRSNVQVAAAYLAYLRDYLAGLGRSEAYWMLVAYNWGPHNLGQLLQGDGSWGSIPPKKQDYAYRILNDVNDPPGWWAELQQPVPTP